MDILIIAALNCIVLYFALLFAGSNLVAFGITVGFLVLGCIFMEMN
jgi:hypothetical protein